MRKDSFISWVIAGILATAFDWKQISIIVVVAAIGFTAESVFHYFYVIKGK